MNKITEAELEHWFQNAWHNYPKGSAIRDIAEQSFVDLKKLLVMSEKKEAQETKDEETTSE